MLNWIPVGRRTLWHLNKAVQAMGTYGLVRHPDDSGNYAFVRFGGYICVDVPETMYTGHMSASLDYSNFHEERRIEHLEVYSSLDYLRDVNGQRGKLSTRMPSSIDDKLASVLGLIWDDRTPLSKLREELVGILGTEPWWTPDWRGDQFLFTINGHKLDWDEVWCDILTSCGCKNLK